jgi:hypothetical protein
MTSKAQAKIQKWKQVLNPTNLINIGYPVFVKNTPIDTGNARAKTTKTATEIQASYPYAKRLDQGYSKQSRDGMTKPTVTAIRAYIKRKLGI